MRSFNSLDLRINTELAPDLEWMLTNPQSNRSTLAGANSRHTVDSLYRLVYSILSEHDAALRTIIEIYRTALVSTDQYHCGFSVQTWLYRIARNNPLCKLRKIRFCKICRAFLEVGGLMTGAPYRFRSSQEPEMVTVLHALDYSSLLIVQLYYRLGLSIEEIAMIEERPQMVISSKLEFARKFIGQSLQKCGPNISAFQSQSEKDLDQQLLMLCKYPRQPWSCFLRNQAFVYQRFITILTSNSIIGWISFYSENVLGLSVS